MVSTRLLTDRGRVPVARMRRHLGQRGDRARRADRHLDLEPADLARERGDRGAHVPPAGVDRAGVRVLAVEEAAGEADGAELQRARGAAPRPRWPTSSSVLPPPMSHSRRRWSNTGTAWSTPRWMRRASSTPEMTFTLTRASSQARSISTSRFSASRTAEVATAVIGRVVDLGDLAEPVEGRDGAVDGVGAELPHVAGARAEPHHLLLALEDLEAGPGVAGGHPGDHAVERVGADVDGGEGLACDGRRRGPRAQSGRVASGAG